MKKTLKRFWIKVKHKLVNKRVRDLEQLLAFEIKQRKHLENQVNDLTLEYRRLKFDIKRDVKSKIDDYEQLFEASKVYGENLLKVAVTTHNKINKGEGKK